MLYKLKQEAKQFFPIFSITEMQLSDWVEYNIHENLLEAVIPKKDIKNLVIKEQNKYTHSMDFIVYGYTIDELKCLNIEKILLDYIEDKK